jgi:hypothetical protein
MTDFAESDIIVMTQYATATAGSMVIEAECVTVYHVPSVSLYMSAINAVDKSVSGLPLRPPLSVACLSDRFGIRSVVVLEITKPSTQHCKTRNSY